MSWYFSPYRQEISRDWSPKNEAERIKKHGLIVSERWGVKYYACPWCKIPRADISEAITCESLCRKEMREARLESETQETERNTPLDFQRLNNDIKSVERKTNTGAEK